MAMYKQKCKMVTHINCERNIQKFTSGPAPFDDSLAPLSLIHNKSANYWEDQI